MESLIESAGTNRMNYLRSMFPDGFFKQYPQEFFASISNQWFTNSSKTVELGLTRFDKGYKQPINQALFFAEVYSRGNNFTYFYTVDTEGNIAMRKAFILRDNNGHIRALIDGAIVYNFTLDDYGNVILYNIVIDKTPSTTIAEYDGRWRNSAFTIILSAIDNESGVKEIYYRINNDPIRTVSVDGQPRIDIEGANNTLEYWSVDYAGNEEEHHILTGIRLDKTVPSIVEIRRQPEGDVEPSQAVKILVNATDSLK